MNMRWGYYLDHLGVKPLHIRNHVSEKGLIIFLSDFQRLLVALESDPDETKRKLAETSRKVSLLRINEKKLIRRHNGKLLNNLQSCCDVVVALPRRIS